MYCFLPRRLLRKQILMTAVNSDMEEAKDKALELFTGYKEHNVSIAPNLRQMAYCAGVRFGGLEEWKFAWHMYKTTRVPSEKSLWLRALGDTQDQYILLRCVK